MVLYCVNLLGPYGEETQGLELGKRYEGVVLGKCDDYTFYDIGLTHMYPEFVGKYGKLSCPYCNKVIYKGRFVAPYCETHFITEEELPAISELIELTEEITVP